MLKNKIRRFLLRSFAFFFLEPRLSSEKYYIRRNCLVKLRSSSERRNTAYRKAKDLFVGVGLCANCNGACCKGNYSRFTVYDHIYHWTADLSKLPEWTYTLHPTKSGSLNQNSEGICSYLNCEQGCSLPYLLRPAICVWWICPEMEKSLSRPKRDALREVREQIDRAEWGYAFRLLLGGMGRSKD